MILPRAEQNLRGGVEAGPNYDPAKVPVAGQIFSIITAILVQILLAVCLTRCYATIASWRKAPIAVWLLLAIYIDSFLFAFASTVLRFGVGVNQSLATCQAAILICLKFYLSTKVLIYFYFVEKAYLVRGSRKPRLKTRLYIFNLTFALGPYVILCWVNVAWRIYYINKDGVCVIGMEKPVLWPLVAYEVIINIYLTVLFLRPLRELYTFQNQTTSSLRTMALRTFFGVCFTLTTSVANLSILTILNGEQGWVCLLICTSDIFVSVMVLHWIAKSYETRTSSRVPQSRIRTLRNVTPARVQSPQPSFHPNSQGSRSGEIDKLTSKSDCPWQNASPIQTRISTGPVDTPSEDGFPLDASRIHVQVRHEVLEENAQDGR
ncbi:uncharacterized protein PV09_04058 [Verruconis gallopava]|uniref:G-protein coupled receptors family 1 profile domain-containing protein n=1 Tax=Verruconis gallopava TaxID=253628 RepID=A0A0D2AD63_9PEZI|nr:uncharacterized protein PV09_04058 [Verruconis gallopava]KIW04883.1 hypothetical protein PV09_04058 [Verruconis gallopava]